MNKSQFSLPEYKAPDTSQFINIHATKLRTYLDELRIDARYLDNQGLALEDSETPKKGRKIGLESLFILSAVSEKHITPDQLVEMDQDETKQQLSSLITVIKQHPRFTLLGDPGIGKSTFIQWFNYLLSYPTENAARDNVGPLLPLTLTARRLQFVEDLDCAKSCNNDEFLDVLLKSMGSVAESLQQEECKQLVVQALARGQVLLMVDGVDEISTTQSHWLATNLRNFLKHYQGIRLVLTARVVGFEHETFWFPERVTPQNTQKKPDAPLTKNLNELSEEILLSKASQHSEKLAPQLYPLLYLAPLDNNRRQAYIENWSKTYIPKKSQVDEFIQSLKRNCFATDYLNTLSRTPVLLTMICFVQLNLRVLPDGRAELYRRIVHTYLVGLDRARNVKAGFTYKNLPYDYDDIQFWIAKLAWLMQCGDLTQDSLTETEREIPFIYCQDRVTSITASNLKRFFAAHIANVTGDKDTADNDAEQLIEFIKKRTGFLIPKGMEGNEEVFSFSHLSFQEYFAGYFITQYWQEWSANEEELNKLQRTLKWDTWQEVWQLAFEETKRRRQSTMLTALFDEDTDFLTDSDANLLLAKLLMNTTLRFEPAQKQRKLLQCWNVANQRHMEGTLTLFWSNKAILDIVLQPEQCPLLSLRHLSQSQLQEFLPRLAEFTLLTELSLFNQKINDISVLSKLTKLIRLNLNYTQVSDISALAKLTNLTYLDLRDTELSDISALTNLTNLSSLDLNSTQVSDLSALAKLTNLTYLDLRDTELSDISALSNLTNLSSLDLNSTQVSDLSALAKLTNLTELYLNGTQISNISVLAKLTNLTYLNLSDTELSDISALSNLTNLTSLDLISTQVSDISVLSKLINLTYLDIYDTQLTDLSVLLHLDSLQVLWLDESTAENQPEIIQQLAAKSVDINIT